MDYQITCVCGHSFLVSQDKLRPAGGGKVTVTCPRCRRRLDPVIEPARTPAPAAPSTPALISAGPPSSDPDAPPDAPAAAVNAEETKRCPYCGEIILAIARKCKHCGEFLDRNPNPDVNTASPDPNAAPTSAPTAPADIPPVYALSVSQWDNFFKYIILLTILIIVACALYFIAPIKQYLPIGVMSGLVLAAFIGWFFYLNAKHTRVYIRPTRIDTEQGILAKDLNSLELFRISDLELKQNIFERMLGIGTIKLMTAESGGGAAGDGHGEPELVLHQIPHAREVYKYIQNQIPIAARQRGAIYMEK